jgi:hypothetical protein
MNFDLVKTLLNEGVSLSFAVERCHDGEGYQIMVINDGDGRWKYLSTVRVSDQARRFKNMNTVVDMIDKDFNSSFEFYRT